MGYMPKAVHRIHIQSKLVSGFFPVAISSALPIQGIVLLMGNDIAGGKVTPTLEVLDSVQCVESLQVTQPHPNPFPVCVVTHAQACKNEGNVSLLDSVLMSVFSGDTELEEGAGKETEISPDNAPPVTRGRLCAAQRADPTLKTCFSNVVSADKASSEKVAYLVDKEVLVRKWTPSVAVDSDWNATYQVVVPAMYRQHVLSVAHESKWAGHLGVAKTYQLILRHFFWPGLKSDVVKYCRCCHVCQIAGKPNQVIPPTPLHPIPAIGEPFERVIIDCVGPLPRTKNGN